MHLKNRLFAKNVAPWILIGCFISYAVLSWILLFRDARALMGISTFYPALKPWLTNTHHFLAVHGINTIPTFAFILVSLIAITAYLVSLKAKLSFKKVIIFAIAFQIITLFSYPILSTDIFSYMFSERVATVHHENIWKVKPATFPEDKFSVMADWKDTTSVYGGVHYFLYLGPSIIGQNNLLLVVILYKLLPALFVWGSGYVLYCILKNQQSDFSPNTLLLVFWHPLVILELFGSGHNDSIMIFFTLLSYYLFKKERWLLSGIILALAVQVKLLPIILCFFLVLSLIRKKAFVSSLLFIAGFIAVNALCFSLMQISPIDFLARVAYNGGVYWQSLPNVLRYFVSGGNLVITGVFLMWLVFFIFRQWRKPTNPLYAYAIILLVYVLFVAAAYWNWYVLWVLSLIPFMENKKVIVTTLVFSFTSLLAYPLLWLSLRFGYQSIVWPFITYAFIFVIPTFLYIFLHYRNDLSVALFKRIGLQTLFAQRARD